MRVREAPVSHELYDRAFFGSIRGSADTSARVIAPLLYREFKPTSVIDIGCGDGTWLSAFREEGVDDLLGVDGAWVNPAEFQVGSQRFRAIDLSQPYVAPRRFDLAISLEVGEHLPPASALVFVESLASCSDLILFSAACPGQGGTNHINEQWPDYWVRLFESQGFRPVDWLRPKIWLHSEVAWWYKQNALLFVRNDSGHASLRSALTGYERLPIVHPGHYEALHRQVDELKRRADLGQQPSPRLIRAAAVNVVRQLSRMVTRTHSL
jgi:hypothetical protein